MLDGWGFYLLSLVNHHPAMKKILLVLTAIMFHTTLNAQRATVPYFENFENGMNGWSTADDGQGTAWELGTPTFGHTLAAFSGINCWDVNLNTGYLNYANCQLISPVFDFTNVTRVYVSFQTNYRIEYLWDYLSVQYTVNNGDSWNYLPFPNLTNPDGFTSRWIESSVVVDELYGYPDVQFRFSFISDGNVVYDGYSIDDFKIEMDPLSTQTISSKDDLFSIYPNPSRGEVNFNFDTNLNENAQVRIYDVTGNEIMRHLAVNLTDSDLLLAQGIYTVVLENDSKMQVKKLVILQ